MRRTAEQIAAQVETLAWARNRNTSVLQNRRDINAMFRAQDDSSKWPINGRFSVTDRAIRQVRALGTDLCGLQYAIEIERAESAIVNDERNW